MMIPKTMGAQMAPDRVTKPLEMPVMIGPTGMKKKAAAIRGAVRKKLQSGVPDGDHARGPGGGSVGLLSNPGDLDHAKGAGG